MTFLVISFVVSCLASAYFILILYLLFFWKKIPFWDIPQEFEATQKISVIIPARNEAANIIACLNSVLNQNYPNHLFEIIVVDDFSEDETLSLVQALSSEQIKVIKLKDYFSADINSYKKQAINLAIQQSTGSLICTLDADCITHPDWLLLVGSYFAEHQISMLAGSVLFQFETGILNRFQRIDFLGMMGVTGGGIMSHFFHMGNGANFAYTKDVYHYLGGFHSEKSTASGDDTELMQKLAIDEASQIGFLKSKHAVVFSNAQRSWTNLIRQRIRWGGKSNLFKEFRLNAVQLIVFLFCWGLIILAVMGIFGNMSALALFTIYFVLKLAADTLMVYRVKIDLAPQHFTIWNLIVVQCIHIVYISFIGIASIVAKEYNWKGRKVK